MSIKNQNIVQKNQNYTVKIIDYGYNGEGIAKINGFTVFVPFTIVGETVDIVIILVKSDYAIGKVLKIIEGSSKRVTPPCPYYKKCGGCQLQHMEYAEQLVYKQNFVKNCLKKYAELDFTVQKVIASPKEYGYRNKFSFPISEIDGKMAIGMYKISSHTIVPIDNCLLQEECKFILDAFLEFANNSELKAYNSESKKGVKHLVCRTYKGIILLTIVSTNKIANLQNLYKKLGQKYKIVNIVVNINNKDNNVILGNADYVIAGTGELKVNEFNLDYSINTHSFMQVNNQVKAMLYNKVLDNIESSSVVIDAYSGAGVLSGIMAKKCKQVYAIEIVNEAIDNANDLVKANNICNLTNICGDCGEELPKLIKNLKSQNIKNLVVVLDPPRKGCDKKVLNALNEALPKTIIYVSCNPATLARDLNYLKEYYNITTIQPYDMFPQTANVETLVCLSIKQ